MPRPASVHPTDGELEILQVLWSHGPCSLGTVREQMLEDREVAASTVATMLRVMADKKLVRRKGNGRGATWSAVVSHKATARGMVRSLVDQVFEGSADRLVAHLVEGGQLSDAELTDIRNLINGKKAKIRATKRGAKQ